MSDDRKCECKLASVGAFAVSSYMSVALYALHQFFVDHPPDAIANGPVPTRAQFAAAIASVEASLAKAKEELARLPESHSHEVS